MKKVYSAQCKTPLECAHEFVNTLATFPKSTPLPFNNFLIHTEESLEEVKAKFENQPKACNVEIAMIFEENGEKKDFALSIL